MQVVFVDTTLTTPPTGGAQTFLVHLCGALVRRGWSVAVVTQPGADHSIAEALAAVGAEVHLNLWRPSHLPEERGEQLARWVNARRPDVYVVSISPDAGWLALPRLDPEIATVSIAHNDVGAFYEPLAHYGQFMDSAVGVSAETHRKIIPLMPEPERARHIPYGVETLSPLQLEEREERGEAAANAPLMIGYVGRLVQEQKRIRDFVPLVAELQEGGTAFELHLIGDGEEAAPLAAEFARRGLSGRVKFWGWQTPVEVREHLRRLHAFVLLSEYEGLPVSLLEAMGHALVPVVTRIASGNVELVRDGENGFVVEVGDTRAAADRLRQLAESHALLRRLRRAAWETGRDYSVERMTERYLDCFEAAVRLHPSREHRLPRRAAYPVMPSCRSKYPLWLRKMKRRLLSAAGALVAR
jgi:glycosyltransferase involved in cell wall biosynthesis